MGKFIDTQYYDTVDSLVKMNEDLVQNPFYSYNDKKCTKVRYYNINNEKTTLDPGSKLAYTDIGDDSPIRFNIIHDLYLYQFIKAELNFENGDFGLESNPLTGESYILPNTIIPTDGDFFEVDHIKDSTWLFKVTDVQRDTLDNGSNVYKIGWSLDRTTNHDILKNIVEEFKYVDTVQGSNLKAIVKLEKYDVAKRLDELGTSLRQYFRGLFYSDKIQTFTYKWYNEYNMYDPFAIEFIIRNGLLEDHSDYLHIKHQSNIPSTFVIEYDRTLYRAFETRNKDKLFHSKYQSQADMITDVTSIFNTRYEDYFALNYNVVAEENGPFNPRGIIPIMDEDLINHIMSGELYTEHDKIFNNIFVKYFNNEDIYKDDIDSILYIDFDPVKDIFYKTLLLIFCVDFYTKKLLS